ncbi:WXG100 family type VII secretion target [Actinokineospora guangxiensis]|jgi:WXG100 family type VII secretion target|uniref:ESAT-6-like protein n=1 Tax=Actinokineospora guangxiensis TaxID=1490288 RepID=A0ABW0EYY7_9PSEU
MIRYDYEAIDVAISMMQKKAQEIANQTDEQQQQVKAIMVGWEGSTALAYNALCDDLEKDLRENVGILEQLKATFQQGANDMQDMDARGGKNVYS